MLQEGKHCRNLRRGFRKREINIQYNTKKD
jgi:hypothetical protein